MHSSASESSRDASTNGISLEEILKQELLWNGLQTPEMLWIMHFHRPYDLFRTRVALCLLPRTAMCSLYAIL